MDGKVLLVQFDRNDSIINFKQIGSMLIQ